jgi:hypothetical protein
MREEMAWRVLRVKKEAGRQDEGKTKAGRKEGRKEGRKAGRREGRKEGKKEGIY